MAFWNRGNRRPERSPASLTLSSVTAAAQRVDLSSPDQIAKLAKAQQQWQADAWFYTDAVGSMKYAERFIANSFRRIVLYAAFIRDPALPPLRVADAVRPDNADAQLPTGEEFADVDPADFLDPGWAAEAETIIASFQSNDGGQAVLMERLGVNLFIPGECYLVNRPVAARRPQEDEPATAIETVLDWEIRSVDEIRKSTKNDKRVMVVDAPDQRDGVELDPAECYVERVWRKHGRWSGWADSNLRAAIPTLETLDLLARLARASVRSRLVAGLALFPDELDFGAADTPAGEGSGIGAKRVSLDRELAELFTEVVGDEADANSIAPAILRGPAELLKEVRVVEFPTRYGPAEQALHVEALDELARTIDLPVEVLMGHMETTYSNAFQINQDLYDDHLAPLVDVGADALTYGLLRPMLTEAGCPPDVVRRMVCAADASALIRNPDRGKVAKEGHDMYALSDQAWRRANDFGDDDAPSDDELARRLVVARGRIDSVLAAQMLEDAGVVPAGTTQIVIDAGGGNAGGGPTASSDAGGAGATASAAPRRDGRRLGMRLSGIDSGLRARLLSAADQAVLRSLERAGARLRTRARTTEHQAAITAAGAVTNGHLGQAVGPAVVAAVLGDEPISADDFADLADRFDRWTAAAQAAAVAEIAKVVTLTDAQRSALTSRQADDRAAAWTFLAGQLIGYSTYRLTAAEDDLDQTGEWDPSAVVRPGLMRCALAIAGGVAWVGTQMGGVTRADGAGPVGGVATGDTINQAIADAGGSVDGYEWVYGSAPRERPFEEHEQLDGITFTDWDDSALAGFEPGDHANCQCDVMTFYADPAAYADGEPEE